MPRISSLNVNGKIREVDADGARSLLSVLRDDLDITGPKYGCGEGECGACAVMIDGSPARSCRIRAENAVNKEIKTIESLAQDGALHPVQKAFLEEEALQCAYCTSGMILTAVALLKRNPNPTREEIIRGMDRNICRCGAYNQIVAAVLNAAKNMREAA